MMIDPIEALADCIMRFEGWFAPNPTSFTEGSTSWRNRNPGNLRDSPLKQSVDNKGYATFITLAVGWEALKRDLQIKLIGESLHNLTPQSTLHDLFSIYAPVLDQNNPTQYSSQIAKWLSEIYKTPVLPSTTLADILKLGKG